MTPKELRQFMQVALLKRLKKRGDLMQLVADIDCSYSALQSFLLHSGISVVIKVVCFLINIGVLKIEKGGVQNE